MFIFFIFDIGSLRFHCKKSSGSQPFSCSRTQRRKKKKKLNLIGNLKYTNENLYYFVILFIIPEGKRTRLETTDVKAFLFRGQKSYRLKNVGKSVR